MTDTSPLAELARLVAPSRPASATFASRRQLGSGTALESRPQRRSVAELLGVVLALSARTRRALQPRTQVEIDVFTPGGGRAVLIELGRKD